MTCRWARRAAGGLIGVSVLLAAWSFALPFVFGLGPRQVPWWREVFGLIRIQGVVGV